MNEQLDQMENRDQLGREEDWVIRPHWAIGLAEGYMQRGVQLCTRDGRVMGNAVVAGFETRHSDTYAVVVTDIGTVMRLTSSELAERFHEPEWVMEVITHAGVQRARITGESLP